MRLIDLLVRDKPGRQGVPVVICDNVTEYLYAGTDQDYWDLTVDFPNLAPPFERCWMETRRPSSILTKAGRERWVALWLGPGLAPERWGVYLEAHELGDVDVETVSTNMFESLKLTYEAETKKIIELLAPYGGPPQSVEEAERLKELLPEFETQRVKDYVSICELMRLPKVDRTRSLATALGDLREKARWSVTADLYVEGLERMGIERNQPALCASFCVTKDGAFCSNNEKNGMTFKLFDQSYRLPFKDQQILGKLTDQLLRPFLLTLCFMHCRNVKVVEVKPNARESERELRKFGKPLVTYRILEIDHLKATLRREGQSETLGLKRALHICRGHFAHYTEERPLFGKKAGTFWIHQHLRGTPEAGRVEKTYAVR